MTLAIAAHSKLAAIAAACLLTVALPSSAMAQKIKTKSPPEAPPQAEISKPEISVEIATIDAVGSSVDEATLRDMLSGSIVDNADALATLDATSITVPTIAVSFSSMVDGEAKSGEAVIQDLVLDDVKDGVAGSVTLGGIELTSNDDFSGSFGEISAKQFDIGGMLGIYGLVDAPDSTDLAVIYSDFAAEGGTIEAEDVSCTIGSMEVAEFSGRPLKSSFADMMAVSQALEAEGDTPSPQTIGTFLHMYADIFTAFKSSPFTFNGFDCSGKDETGAPLDFSIESASTDGMSPGIYPAVKMEGLKIAVEGDGEVSVGNIAIKATDLSGPIALVEAAPAAIDQAWFEANARALVPAFGGFSFEDIKVDVPNPDAEGERIVASVGGFDLSLEDYFNGIPTAIASSASHIVVDLPTDTADEQLQQLINLGVTSVDIGYVLKAAWDEAADAIEVEEVSINGANLASVALAGTIGNATKALFDTNPDTALAAGMAVVIQNLKLDVVDEGLADIVLASVAAEQGSDAATMRPIFAGLAEGTIIGMLAGAAEAQNVGAAVSSFIKGEAKSLTIELTAKEEPGLGMADFMAAEQDPTVLIGKTNITATAK
ncbi:hypothetical protein [uncultured Devosia sp.]|uniref:hypothetical protein n=1 Tax=uncultured Devosia sp. TaxID=211434 RepID=UPI0035CA8CD3